VLYNATDSILKMISVDLVLKQRGRAMAEALQRQCPAFRLLEGGSRQVLSAKFVSREFPEGIDFATIDGDHTYEGCMFDLAMIAPAMSPTGVIVVDDYRSGPPNGVIIESVTQSVDDFLTRHRESFVGETWNRRGKGFCIIRRVRH
jgi:hypothetical protein